MIEKKGLKQIFTRNYLSPVNFSSLSSYCRFTWRSILVHLPIQPRTSSGERDDGQTQNDQRAALSAALSLCIAGGAYAQSTTGGIYGTVPSASGNTTVQVTNNSGFSRTVQVGADGRYNFNALPVGSYKITVQRDGQVIGTRDVTVIVGAGTDASFAGVTCPQ